MPKRLTCWKLLRRFYSGGESPEELKKIDSNLRAVQKSSIGFQLADVLLASEDAIVRSFAASTFVVKINRDWYAAVSPSFLIGTLLSVAGLHSRLKIKARCLTAYWTIW